MQDLELDLKDWRNHPSPETMRSKSLQHERTFPLRSAIGVSVAATIVLVAFLLTRSNPAQAALARMNASFKNVESVWMDTDTNLAEPERSGKGITIIAHGSLRRDGLRGFRALRTKEGTWQYDPSRAEVVRPDPMPNDRYSPRTYTLSALVDSLDSHDELRDLGFEDSDGMLMRHVQMFTETARHDIWADALTDRPILVVSTRLSETKPYNTCRFRYDVRIDPSVMTPEALAKPLTDLIRPFPPESPNTR